MIYLKLFEEFSNNLTAQKLSDVLKGLSTNNEFLTWGGARHYTEKIPLKITNKFPNSLIDGYCDTVAIFIKLHYMNEKNLKIVAASDNSNSGFDHVLLKFNNKFYDAYNVDGVENISDLFFFDGSDKNSITYSVWNDVNGETLDIKKYL